MSRWSLLRSSIGGKRETGAASIHNFYGGFDRLLQSRKVIWLGFEFKFEVQVHLSPEQQLLVLLEAADAYMCRVDSAECAVTLTCEVGDEERVKTSVEQMLAAAAANERRVSLLSIEEGGSAVKVQISHKTLIPMLSRAEFMMYTIAPNTCDVFTRERPRSMGVGAKGLLSNIIHDGIDNTGNVRVWEAEQILLIYLSSIVQNGELELLGKSVLELGGGMTGLCGLGLARLCRRRGIGNVRVTITDGHPDSVRNQKVCISMNDTVDLRAYLPPAPVTASLLRWSLGDKHGDLERLRVENGQERFDFILAADCLFFQDFHDDLLWLLDNALAEMNGVVYLLQPRRGDTMAKFLEKASQVFEADVQENFCDEITAQLSRASAEPNSGFCANVHTPILVKLKRR